MITLVLWHCNFLREHFRIEFLSRRLDDPKHTIVLFGDEVVVASVVDLAAVGWFSDGVSDVIGVVVAC
ncbi:hypothetical protein CTI12_AA462960 [Artemisia annua]|uniref:Uncharacterized protein n=1 Tax=Artemisia annua TaxID=35608 RepID=A0A2U1LR68_ARTAN|nr:hypothetical protein CTI12_AA462960 [Artemisia annua]